MDLVTPELGGRRRGGTGVAASIGAAALVTVSSDWVEMLDTQYERGIEQSRRRGNQKKLTAAIGVKRHGGQLSPRPQQRPAELAAAVLLGMVFVALLGVVEQEKRPGLANGSEPLWTLASVCML